jgi:hypothetical protein
MSDQTFSHEVFRNLRLAFQSSEATLTLCTIILLHKARIKMSNSSSKILQKRGLNNDPCGEPSRFFNSLLARLAKFIYPTVRSWLISKESL